MNSISAVELKSLLNREDVILIDVREPAEYRAEHIQGSYPLPLSEFSLEKLPQDKSILIIQCRTGSRSSQACQKVLSANISPSLEVFNLNGGLEAWKAAGLPITQSVSQPIPLDRQTQIAAGFMALSGTLLGAFVNPLFYIIPGFIGSGLIFAGLTGWCGMAKFLARMPWNQ